jgi:hypothetical protein
MKNKGEEKGKGKTTSPPDCQQANMVGDWSSEDGCGTNPVRILGEPLHSRSSRCGVHVNNEIKLTVD